MPRKRYARMVTTWLGFARIPPGSKDPDILQRAVAEQQILLTFDKDFGDLAFHFGLPANCGIMLFRLQASSSAALAAMVVTAVQSRNDWAGQYSVIELGRICMRPLPTRQLRDQLTHGFRIAFASDLRNPRDPRICS